MAAAPAKSPPLYEEFFIAGFAAVGSICFTNPIDVVKTRMTVQGPVGPISNPLQGLGHIEHRGTARLAARLPASCLWQFSNVSVRFGVYGVAKTATGVADAKESPLAKWLKSLGLAGVSGGLAALASNPFFILETRFQASLQSSSASSASSAAAGATTSSAGSTCGSRRRIG